MKTIRDGSEFSFIGFYLAPAPYHPDQSWMTHAKSLSDQGWGFAIIFVGQQVFAKGAQDHENDTGNLANLTMNNGSLDASDLTHGAITLAMKAGFRSGATIFLDIEHHNQGLLQNMINYYKGWTGAVVDDGQYVPGVYCPYGKNGDWPKALLEAGKSIYEDRGLSGAPAFWVVNDVPYVVKNRTMYEKFIVWLPSNPLAPSGSDVPFAKIWQFSLDGDISPLVTGIAQSLSVDLDFADSRNPSNASVT